jgi:preprotein translocase subunit SecE
VPQISPSGSTQSQPERPGPETPPPASSPAPDADDAAIGQEGFLTATLAELRRVVWPSRQQLFSESIAVILMVGLSAASIAALDRFYRWVSIQVFR